jgi:hypothetical protein
MSEETPELNPRNKALAEINQQANEKADAEGTPLAEDWEGKAARGEDPVAKPEPEKAPEMLTIKVDGVEVQVTREQAIEAGVRALQKDKTADQRLTEATRLLNEAKQYKPPPVVEATPTVDADLELEVKLIQDAPFNDEAARKLAELRRKQSTPQATLTPDQIERFVDNRLQGRDAIAAFETEFKDIVSDPYLARLAASEDEQLLKSGDTRPPLERWTEVGTKLRAWRGTTITQTLDAKRERKESITNLPAANARPAVTEEPKPRTPSQIVEDVRRARHQRV